MENVVNKNENGFWVTENVYVRPNSYELDIYPPSIGRTDKYSFTVNGNEIGYFDIEADTYEEIKAKAEEFIAKWERANTNQIMEKASLEAQMMKAVRGVKPEDFNAVLEKFKEATKNEVQELLNNSIPSAIQNILKENTEADQKFVDNAIFLLERRLKVLEGGK